MNAMPLKAETFVALSAPHEVMHHLRDHFEEHGLVAGSQGAWSVTFEIGSASAEMRSGGISFRVDAADDASLALLQWSVAEHVHEFAGHDLPSLSWNGGTAAGAGLPYFREMTVKAIADVTPHMRRLTLTGDDLGRFAEKGYHVRLLLPPRTGVVPVWPVMAEDGRQAWPEGERPAARVYTIRRIDVAAGEVDIDFVLHEGADMPGARFAMEASVGAKVGMTGPGGGTLKAADHHILIGDETALPAIGRTLEDLPAGARTTVFAEVHDEAEIQALGTKADVEFHWLSRAGRPAGTTSVLLDALKAAPESLWAGEPRLWAGCEHAAAQDLRHYVREERGIAKGRSPIAAYWRRGVAGDEI